MQVLLNFLIKHNHWFLFLLLEGISFMLIVRFNNYQSATFFTAANGVAGNLYSMIADIDAYFELKNENDILLSKNLELTKENQALHEQLAAYQDNHALEEDTIVKQHKSDYIFNTARVINNSLNAVNNYIVLDKGRKEGIETEMGVFDNKGVIGVIYLTSNGYSVVIPLLNSKSSISCRVSGSDSFCTLQWDGKDTQYSYLVDLPRYTKFEQGDTVVTSGFSSIFPGNIPVGTIDKVENSADGMFYRARVKLAVDFSKLTSVYIVGNKGYNEEKQLEKSIPSE